VDSGGGLLADSDELGDEGVPLLGVLLNGLLDDGEDLDELDVGGGGRVGQGAVLGEGVLVLDSLVDEEGGITTVVDDDVWARAIRPEEGALSAPPVLLDGLTLPGEHGGSSSGHDGGSCVVLGGEDVARAPTNISTQVGQGLDEDGGLDGHVERTHDASSLQRLRAPILSTKSHQTRHLNLSKLDLLATKVSKADILNTVITAGGCRRSHH